MSLAITPEEAAISMEKAVAETTVSENLEGALIKAAKSNDIAQIQALLNSGADVNTKDNDNKTALMWAALKGHANVVKLLLDKGAYVHVKSRSSGKTALQYATDKGFTEIIRLLRKAGARE
jgi:ankyrin repeat protein